MLRQILTRNHNLIKAIAEAWFSSGANYFGVWEDGTPLFEFRTHGTGEIELTQQVLQAPVDSNVRIEVRLPGLAISGVQARLSAEADLIAQIIRLSTNMEGLAAELIDTQDQLLAIYNLTQATRHYIDIEKLLKQLAKETVELLRADSAFVIFETPGQSYFVEHYPEKMLDDVYLDLAYRSASQSGYPYLSSEELRTKALVNFLLVPIRIRDEPSAALGFTKKTGDFMSPDIKLAQALAEHSGAQIENVLLYKKSLDQMKLQTELELARQVQLNLLPRKPPHINGLDLWAASRPALQVGGDFFDFQQKIGHPFSFAVGDISGKGLPAALLMSITRTVIRSKTNDAPTPTPGDIVSEVNKELYDDFTDVSMFATVFVGQYNHRHLIYANAGHSPVIYRPMRGKARLLEADGTALGVLPTSFSQDHELNFQPGDLLVVGTDGLNETQNDQREMFGCDRLLDLVNTISDLPAQEIGQALYQAVTTFSTGEPQFDDQTLMVIKGM